MVADGRSKIQFEVSSMELASLIMPLSEWHSMAKKLQTQVFIEYAFLEAHEVATTSRQRSAYENIRGHVG